MHRPKLSLPLDDRPVLVHVIDAFLNAGVKPILVVIGPHVPELIEITTHAGGVPIVLPESTPDMRSTILHGLDRAEQELRPTDHDGFMLAPGDQVTLTSAIVTRMMNAWDEPTRTGSILIPQTELGKRGHPCVISWQHVAAIRAIGADVGLNAYLREHEAETCLIPLGDPAILGDMDTPEDYARLLGQSPKPGKND